MKRKPRLTKRERKALAPARPQPTRGHQDQHIHCIACGKHLHATDFEAPATATFITCDHGANFASCVTCMSRAMAAVQEHDRTNQPVKVAPAWH